MMEDVNTLIHAFSSTGSADVFTIYDKYDFLKKFFRGGGLLILVLKLAIYLFKTTISY